MLEYLNNAGRGLHLSITLVLLVLLNGCKPADHVPEAAPDVVQPESLQPSAYWPAYYQLAQQFADASRDCINQLHAGISRLLDSTDEQHLQMARQQLKKCVEKQSVVQGIRLGSTSAQAELARLQQRLFTRVTYPGFIDALQQHPYSGIVQDGSLAMDRMALEQQHGVTDSSEVSLGLDVIGFLLDGEHRYRAAVPLRTVSELIAPTAGTPSAESLDSDHPQQRRRAYLALVTEIARDDARKQAALWQRESTRSPTAEQWPRWVNKMLERQQRLLDSALISSNTLRGWWQVWHLPLGNGTEPRSLASFLPPWDQRDNEQAGFEQLLGEADTDDTALREQYARWLLADTTTATPATH